MMTQHSQWKFGIDKKGPNFLNNIFELTLFPDLAPLLEGLDSKFDPPYCAASMNDPELKVRDTESLVVIKDKYPKAKHHYLVLPKERILNLASLEASHVTLLKEMCRLGRQLTEEHPAQEFRWGVHI